MDADQSAVAWYGRQGKLLAHAVVVGSLLKIASDECRDIIADDPALAPEIAVLADSLNFGVAAAAQIVDVIGARLAARREETSGVR